MALSPEILDRLKTNLLTSGLQNRDNPLYQVINQLIDYIKQMNLVVVGSISNPVTIEQTILQQFMGLDGGNGGGDSESIIAIPGPIGSSGAPGTQGPMGQMGAIIFPPDAEDGQMFPPIVGPQGNPGPTGSNGPVGPMMVVEDGRDGEDGMNVSTMFPPDVALIRKPITELEFESLNSAPLDIGIPAPGANKIIVPLHAWLEIDLAAAYGTSPTYTIVYDGSTANLMSTTMTVALTSVLTKKSDSVDGGVPTFVNYTTFDPRNKLIRLRGSANPTNPGVGIATAVLNLFYGIITTT